MEKLVINYYLKKNLLKCQIMKKDYNKKQKVLNKIEIKKLQNIKKCQNKKENN